MATEHGYLPGAIVKKTTKKYVAPTGKPFELWAVCEHISEGGPNTWQYLQTGTQPSSSTFFVDKAGRIYQMASIYERTWANGLNYVDGRYIDPQGTVVNPPWWRLHTYPGIDPNKFTVSVEHEGWPNDERTPAMIAADVRILSYIHGETGIIWIAEDTLIGHRHISPVNRPNCPGPKLDLHNLAELANVASGVDPLRLRWIADGTGREWHCGVGFYDYYNEIGGLRACGHPLSNEYPRSDQLGAEVTVMQFERLWLKYKAGDAPWSVRTMLLSEIAWMRSNR